MVILNFKAEPGSNYREGEKKKKSSDRGKEELKITITNHHNNFVISL